jgi:nucleoside-diphosphate-sugar epimerase
VGDAPALTEQEWLYTIAEHATWRKRVVSLARDKLPAHLQEPLDFAHHMVLDTSRIRREPGYTEIVPLDAAMRRTLAWERAHPAQDGTPTPEEYAAEDAVLASL